MKIFKKFCLGFLVLITTFGAVFFTACKKDEGLSKYVSELRQDIFEGSGTTLKLKAVYGYKESPYLADGKIGTHAWTLTFTILGTEQDDVTYTLFFNHGGKEYKTTFKKNEASGLSTAVLPVESFNDKHFEVTVAYSSEQEKITLASIVPEGTLSYSKALATLEQKQPSLIKSYKSENGTFTAEIFLRVVVKDGNAYWYIGLANEDGGLKALLIDGKSGELLAVREVF